MDETQARKNWRGKLVLPKPQTITVAGDDPQYTRLGGHARAVIDVIRGVGLTPKIIGISGEQMSYYGLEDEIDADLTKWGIGRLAATLASFEEAE